MPRNWKREDNIKQTSEFAQKLNDDITTVTDAKLIKPASQSVNRR